jgi:hypothetical protein
MTGLAELVTELRQAADANPLDVGTLPSVTPQQFRVTAAGRVGWVGWLEIHGHKVRLGFTRNRIGSRDFYHLSINSRAADHLEPGELAAIVAAFFPGEEPLAIPSELGNTLQFLGTPFANGTHSERMKDEG